MAKSPWRSVFDFTRLLKTSVSKEVAFLRYILWSVQDMLTLSTSSSSAIPLWKHFSFDGMGSFQHPRRAAPPPSPDPPTLPSPADGSSRNTAQHSPCTKGHKQSQIQLLQAVSVPASVCGRVTSLRAPSKANHWEKKKHQQYVIKYLSAQSVWSLTYKILTFCHSTRWLVQTPHQKYENTWQNFFS